MKVINKIKRKNRNKKLSKFADKMYYATWNTSQNVFVHPLVFEIIRFRYFGKLCCTLHKDEFLCGGKDYFRIVTLLSEYEGVI